MTQELMNGKRQILEIEYQRRQYLKEFEPEVVMFEILDNPERFDDQNLDWALKQAGWEL